MAAANEEVVLQVSQGPDYDIGQQYAATCWGCGLELFLPYSAPAFKCGWCGAISFTTAESYRGGRKCLKCAIIRDRSLVFFVLAIVIAMTGTGVWATFPVIFSSLSFWLLVHSSATIFLALNTIVNYCFAAILPAGPVPPIAWGKVDEVRKGALEGHTYCTSCRKPKPPEAHHCRTCGTCVVDMDHHCPFIGNCVGANNHRHFILFLIFTILSCIYVLVMSAYAGSIIWPSLLKYEYGSQRVSFTAQISTVIAISFTDTASSMRSFILIYLIATSLSVFIGVGLLLRQQMQLLYHGQTYIDSIQRTGEAHLHSGWDNLRHIFGNSHPVLWMLPKHWGNALGKKLHIR